MSDQQPSSDRQWSWHYALRQREGLAFLVAAGRPVSKHEVVAHVSAIDPPAPADREVLANGSERWENQFLWSTTGLVKAGLLEKDGSGTWTATETAAGFLTDYQDPISFEREINRRYHDWREMLAAPGRRAWLIKGSAVLGQNVVPGWLSDSFVSIAAAQLSEPARDVTPSELRSLVQESYAHLKHQTRKDKQDEIMTFVTQVRLGDVVITTHEHAIVIGDVTGDWTWHPTPEGASNLRRTVEWRNAETPIDFADLPAPLPARLQTGRALVELTEDLDLIESLANDAAPPPVSNTPVPSLAAEVRHTQLPMPTEAFADKLLVSHEWLCEVVELLNERRQVILYGPPGTGKTYIAQQLANALAGLEQVKLVQFHPSYTYEDFFEGYRPTTGGTDGTLSFELRPGPLRRIVTRAHEHPDQAFVLIIDEINRANLAKVFGELYFLLEYRDQAVELLYSPEDVTFTLPRNLYLIGTMNTADRSIALVDAAMRRRFAFVPLDPSVEPTASILTKWLLHESLPPAAALVLEELNRRIGDPDFLIGPSYFMKSKDHSKAKLARVWRTTIVPLLEEHYYGRWEREAGRFDFDKVWSGLSPSTEVPAPDTVSNTPPTSGL